MRRGRCRLHTFQLLAWQAHAENGGLGRTDRDMFRFLFPLARIVSVRVKRTRALFL
jgi:hypothetical protein